MEVPVIGETKLGSAYVLYEYPSYAAFGGQYRADILDLVSVSGGVDAEADFAEGLFNIHGSVRACLHIIDDICEGRRRATSPAGAAARAARGRASSASGMNIGGGVQWQRLSEPFIWPFDGCKWSRFTAVVRSSAVRVAQAGGPYTIKVEQGKPSPALQLDGAGGAPTVRVRGPGGQLFEAPAGKGYRFSPDKTIRILRFDGKAAKMTIVGLQNAQPGTYTVETLPGLAAASPGSSRPPTRPTPRSSGRVTGKGRRRVLHYDVRRAAGPAGRLRGGHPEGGLQADRHHHQGAAGASVPVGPGPWAGAGWSPSSSSPAIPAERKVLTTFTPQSPILAKPKRIRVRRRGSRACG